MSPFLVLMILPMVASFVFLRTYVSLNSEKRNRGTVKFSDAKYDKAAWESGYTTCSSEVCERLATDSLPKDLRGTYFRNGHAKFESGEHQIIHPFDGDGMITAVDIQNGNALFRNRFVRTEVFKQERRRKRILRRGAFGTPKTGGIWANIFDIRTRDVANTNVLYWGNRLLTLFESTNPHSIEPDSLRTIAKTTLKGQLKQNQPFSAHPKVDANTGRLVTFSSQPRGTTKTAMTLYEFNTTFDIVQQRTVEIPGFVFFHDFVVTKNYYIFTKSPLNFKPLPFLLGRKGPAQCISFDPQGPCELILIPRDASQAVQYVPVDPHFNFHYANGYEYTRDVVSDSEGSSGDSGTSVGTSTHIVIDTVRCARMELGEGTAGKPVWRDLDYAKLVPYSRLVRYTLTKSTTNKQDSTNKQNIVGGGSGGSDGSGSGWSISSSRELSDVQLDFPSVHPRVMGKQYQYVYASASLDATQSAPVQGLIKLDFGCSTNSSTISTNTITSASSGAGTTSTTSRQEERWDPQPHEFLGEVVFAPKHGAGPDAAEDDGYLLSFLWDGQQRRSYLVVFDAQHITQGPFSKVPLPVNVPFGLHGTFVPDLVYRTEDVQRKFDAFTAIDSKKWNEMSGGFSGLGITQQD